MKRNLLTLLTVLAFLLCTNACSNNDNSTPPDITPLTEWQAGKIVSTKAVTAYGGIDKCFAAEPIPDGVWQRMQGKTYKENPHIGRDDLRHIRALHWDYDNQMHIGEMVCNKVIADRVARILRQLFDAKYPIQRMLLPDVYDADDETQMRDNNSSCFCYTLTIKSAMMAHSSFSPPQPKSIVTATGISPTRLIMTTSAFASSPRPDSNGAATGPHVKTISILNL